MSELREYEIQVEIENACLLDCVHCSSLEMRTFKKRTYSDDTLVDFISRFPNPVHVYLTGGDPILYPNLIDLCNRIVACNSKRTIGLYTSGNCPSMKPILQELAILLYNSGVRDAYFSIYSDISEEHDQFTRYKGSLYNTLLSVEQLSNAGIIPKAHLVLTKQNHKKIDRIINFCKSVGFCEVRILKLTPFGNALNNWDWIGVPEETQNEAISVLIQQKDEYGINLSFSGYPRIHPCRALSNAHSCQAGTNLIYVTLSGDVYPCACSLQYASRYMLGNISEPNGIFRKLHTEYCNEYNVDCILTYQK